MPKKIDHKTFRLTLLESAISCASKKGFDGVTTKAIAKECGFNEAYIYRYFVDKNDLLFKAFLYLDELLFNKLTDSLVILAVDAVKPRDRYYRFVKEVWNFFIENEDNAKFYICFYYTSFISPEIIEIHRHISQDFVSRLARCLKDDSTYPIAIHQILSTFTSFINYVINGTIENTEDNLEIIFQALVNLLDYYLDFEKIDVI